MKRLLLAAAFACIAGAVNTASHAQTVSFPKVLLDEAGKILNSYPKDLSERDRAKIIYDNIWYLEKIIAVCPAYVEVNVDQARNRLFINLQVWNYFYGVGTTATGIAQEVAQEGIKIFNNSSSYSEWCKHVRDTSFKNNPDSPVFSKVKK